MVHKGPGMYWYGYTNVLFRILDGIKALTGKNALQVTDKPLCVTYQPCIFTLHTTTGLNTWVTRIHWTAPNLIWRPYDRQNHEERRRPNSPLISNPWWLIKKTHSLRPNGTRQLKRQREAWCKLYRITSPGWSIRPPKRSERRQNRPSHQKDQRNSWWHYR